MSRHRSIITLSLFCLSGDDIGKLKAKQVSDRHLVNWLPEYCLTIEGRVKHTAYWLQFEDRGPVLHWLFDVEHIEQPLAEEVSNLGMEWLTDRDSGDLDLSFLRDLPALTYEQMSHSLNASQQIVFDVEYSKGYDSEGNAECDMEITVVGYLDSEKRLVDPVTKKHV